MRIFRIVGASGVAAFLAFVHPIRRPLFRDRSTEPVQRCRDATTRGIRTEKHELGVRLEYDPEGGGPYVPEEEK